MGGACSRHAVKATNEPVDEEAHFEPPVEVIVRALVIYVDYGFEPAKSMGWCPAGFGDKLDTPENAAMFKQLLLDAGCTSIEEMSNLDATKENVLATIEEVG